MTESPRKFRVPLNGQDDLVGGWVTAHAGGSWFPGRGRAIGLIDNLGIAAGVIFEGFSGTNVYMHVAARADLKKRWLTRKYLWMCFHYPFVQLKCRRVTASVSSANKDCLKFVQALGFVHEATLEGAAKDGDLLVYVLWATSERVQFLMKYGEDHDFEQAGHPETA